jgi:hypothetical protein
LGSPKFKACIDTLQVLHSKFGRKISDGLLENYQPDEFMSFEAVNASTRYFTSRKEDPYGRNEQFSQDVDPKGILGSLATDRYFHGMDNVVDYFSALPQLQEPNYEK